MARITRVALTEFSFTAENIGLETAAAGVGNMAYVPGGNFAAKRFAVAIDSDQGARGEYVVSWVGTPSSYAQPGDLPPGGCVPVPDGPGLGVAYDWDYIAAHKTQEMVFA